MSDHSKAQTNRAGPQIADALDTDRDGQRDQHSPAPEAAAAIAAARSTRLRENLLRLIAEHRLTFAQLARRSGMPTANALYNFTNGRTAGLSQQTLEQICNAIPGITIDELVGRTARKAGRHAGAQTVPTKAGQTTAYRAVALALDRLSGSLAALSIVLDAAGNAAAEATQCAKALLAIE
jgi:transcriptional regulator with XRE-family HTH domain